MGQDDVRMLAEWLRDARAILDAFKDDPRTAHETMMLSMADRLAAHSGLKSFSRYNFILDVAQGVERGHGRKEI